SGLVNLFDATDPEHLGTANEYDVHLGSACPVAYNLEFVGQRYLYIACGNGIEIVDLLSPASPVLLGLYTAAGGVQDEMKAVENLVYVATGSLSAGPANPPRIKVLDVTDPTHPVVVGQIDVERRARSIAISGNVLAVAENESNLSYSTGTVAIFDLSQSPSQPQFKGRVGDNLTVYRGVAIVGNSVFSNDGSGIHKIDIARLDDPYFVSQASFGGFAPALAAYGDKLIMGSFDSTDLSIIRTSLQP
ncbi:MAG: hypothetical protein AAB589_00560, partial [Patescibacteria group bacterium]